MVLVWVFDTVPSAFDYDVQTQQPVDRWKRVELNHACVEFVAPTEYMVSAVSEDILYTIFV